MHQILVALFFGLVNGSNKDLFEIHDNFSRLCVGYDSILSPPIHHFRSLVQIFIQLVRINYQLDWNKITLDILMEAFAFLLTNFDKILSVNSSSPLQKDLKKRPRKTRCGKW